MFVFCQMSENFRDFGFWLILFSRLNMCLCSKLFRRNDSSSAFQLREENRVYKVVSLAKLSSHPYIQGGSPLGRSLTHSYRSGFTPIEREDPY